MKREYYIIRRYLETDIGLATLYLTCPATLEWLGNRTDAAEFTDYGRAVHVAQLQPGDCEIVHVKERVAFQFKH